MAFMPPPPSTLVYDYTDQKTRIRHIKYRKKNGRNVVITIYPGGSAAEDIREFAGIKRRWFHHTEHVDGTREERFVDSTGVFVEVFFDANGKRVKRIKSKGTIDPKIGGTSTTTVIEEHFIPGKRKVIKRITKVIDQRFVTNHGERADIREKKTTEIYKKNQKGPTKTTIDEWWFKNFGKDDSGTEGKKKTTKVPGKTDVVKEWERNSANRKWKVVK